MLEPLSVAGMRPEDQYTIYEPFKFGVAIAKSYREVGANGKSQMILEGVASTENIDAQNEQIIQKGMDFRPFLMGGYINWNHNGLPTHVVGVPLAAGIVTHQGVPAFWVKAKLWDDSPMAQGIWDLAQMIEQNNADGGPERHLGWSVEGAVVDRDPTNQQIISRSIVRHCALTHEPVNTDSFASIVKSFGWTGSDPSLAAVVKAMTAGPALNPSTLPNGGLEAGVGPLKLENVDDRPTSVLLNGPCHFWQKALGEDVLKSDEFDATRGVWRQGTNSLLRYLIGKGVRLGDAIATVDGLRASLN